MSRNCFHAENPSKIPLEHTLFTLLVMQKSRRLPDIFPAKGDAQEARGFAWRSLVDALTTTVIFRQSATVYYSPACMRRSFCLQYVCDSGELTLAVGSTDPAET